MVDFDINENAPLRNRLKKIWRRSSKKRLSKRKWNQSTGRPRINGK